MTALLIISLLLAVSFPGIAAVRMRSIPVSISSLVYVFSGSCKWLWTTWLWAVTFTLAPSLMDALPLCWQYVGFLTLVSLVTCGAMPLFMIEKHKWHSIFGISAGILSQVCVAVIYPWCLLLWSAFIYMITDAFVIAERGRWYDGKEVFVLESICVISTFFSIFIATFL